jgi:hypothetical protein
MPPHPPVSANERLECLTEPCKELHYMKGLAFPQNVKFRHVLVTGPPGAGKSTIIRKLGGWPEEGYLDLSRPRWWADQALAIRPREVHLGFPFVGFRRGLAIFDSEWRESRPRLDVTRIQIPPAKKHFFSVDWRNRYVFEFLLPSENQLFKQRQQRAERGTHPVDAELTRVLIDYQLEVFRQSALYLSRSGVRVYIREGISSPPLCIVQQRSRDE